MRAAILVLPVALAIPAAPATAATFDVTYTTQDHGTGIADAGAGVITLPGFRPGQGGVPADAVLTGAQVTFSGRFAGTLLADAFFGDAFPGALSGADGWAFIGLESPANAGIGAEVRPFRAGDAFELTDRTGAFEVGFSGTIAPFAFTIPTATLGVLDGQDSFAWEFNFIAPLSAFVLEPTMVLPTGTTVTGSLDAAVTYSFTAATGTDAPRDAAPGVVPLPAAGWLLLSGLGGLAWLRRRAA